MDKRKRIDRPVDRRNRFEQAGARRFSQQSEMRDKVATLQVITQLSNRLYELLLHSEQSFGDVGGACPSDTVFPARDLVYL